MKIQSRNVQHGSNRKADEFQEIVLDNADFVKWHKSGKDVFSSSPNKQAGKRFKQYSERAKT